MEGVTNNGLPLCLVSTVGGMAITSAANEVHLLAPWLRVQICGTFINNMIQLAYNVTRSITADYYSTKDKIQGYIHHVQSQSLHKYLQYDILKVELSTTHNDLLTHTHIQSDTRQDYCP